MLLFFEGFNSTNSDPVKLDPTYWTASGDHINFTSMRTHEGIQLRNRPAASGLEHNHTLTLSNFTDPLVSHSGFGLGFYSSLYGIRTRPTGVSSSPYAENLVSFFDYNGEVLRIDIERTTFGGNPSVGLSIYQNGSLVDTYDLESPVGNSWTIQPWGSTGSYHLSHAPYLEFHIDPLNETMAIRVSANNTFEAHLLNSGSTEYTAISGWTALSGIVFYANNDVAGADFGNAQGFDDLYLTAGNDVDECLLGQNTKIYRQYPQSDSIVAEWLGASYGTLGQLPYSYYLSSNNGDTDFIYTDVPNARSLYYMDNINEPAPSGVGGVKVVNVVKKSSLLTNMSFTNIMATGDDITSDIGSPFTVDHIDYKYQNSFYFENPITVAPWTKDDVNSMQLGVKLL